MINIITVVSGPSAHILGLNGNDCDSSDFFDFLYCYMQSKL